MSLYAATSFADGVSAREHAISRENTKVLAKAINVSIQFTALLRNTAIRTELMISTAILCRGFNPE